MTAEVLEHVQHVVVGATRRSLVLNAAFVHAQNLAFAEDAMGAWP